MADFNFIGGSSRTRTTVFDNQRTVNLYPEASGSGTSKGIAMLLGCPGLTTWATLAGGGVRGAIRVSAAQLIVVVGGNVYSLTTTGVSTLIGTIVSRTTPVDMAWNGNVVMIVTGPEGYFVDPVGRTITRIGAPFVGADRVDYVDGYFIFNVTGTQKFQITALLGTSIDALDFATAEGAPDLLISLLVNQREVWLFGETSTEVFFDSGNADFPFERIQGAFIEQGCAAKYSPAKAAGAVFWLTANEHGQGMVVQATGYQPARISTHAVEYAIAQMSSIDDAIGLTYQQEGHTFYQLTFPTGNQTWVYDLTTQLWHERVWRDPADGSLNRHRAQCVVPFAGQMIVGDWGLPKLYTWSLDVFADDGQILPAIRQGPHLFDPSGRWLIVDRFWLDLEAGVGLNSGQGSDPIVVLEWSTDGGKTFPNSINMSAGKIGERRRRAIGRRLGKGRDFVFRVTITDPVKRALVNADVQVRVMNA